MWIHYHARHLGIPYQEYILMTVGEIEDLMICSAISAGAYDEVVEIDIWKLR